jgi:hypothetical protein
MKNKIIKTAKDLEQGTITEIEAKNLLLCLFGVSVNEVEFCTCGNPSGEGNIQMVNDEEMLYSCCDCNNQVQN